MHFPEMASIVVAWQQSERETSGKEKKNSNVKLFIRNIFFNNGDNA
jgi:hypothetical protein